MSKKELANLYKLSRGTLAYLLNVRFYKELQVVGYNKEHKTLAPKVVRRFIELYGQPIKIQQQTINTQNP